MLNPGLTDWKSVASTYPKDLAEKTIRAIGRLGVLMTYTILREALTIESYV